MFIVVSESHWQELKKVQMSLRPATKRKAKGKLLEFPVLAGAFDDGLVWQLLNAIRKRKEAVILASRKRKGRHG